MVSKTLILLLHPEIYLCDPGIYMFLTLICADIILFVLQNLYLEEFNISIFKCRCLPTVIIISMTHIHCIYKHYTSNLQQ